MNVCFDIQHPAHVHLFKHALRELQAAGHGTLVLSRDKEMTVALLDAYGIDHCLLSRRRGGPAAAVELALREVRTFRAARRFDPDVFVSRMSTPAAHASRLLGARNVAITDTDLDSTPLGRLVHGLTLPFVDVLCHSPGLQLPRLAAEHRVVPFQELAYLHPNRFSPDAGALRAHGVDPETPYYVLRLAGWDAYHDVGRHGIERVTLRDLVSYLSAHGNVYVSAERELPSGIDAEPLPTPPHLVHDLLAFANVYVGDSGTMSTEAALLGTPAVRVASNVGVDDERVFRTLEDEYGLLASFADGRDAVGRVRELVESETTGEKWRKRRRTLLADARDVTGDLLAVIEEAAGEEHRQTAVA
jgi:predicted glycosyltransferase